MLDTAYLRDERSWFNCQQVSWRKPAPAARELMTELSDDDFEQCGLMTVTRPNKDEFLNKAFAEQDAPTGQQWLVRGPANDDVVVRDHDHAWLSIVQGRIDEMRDAAREDDLPFDDESAAAAFAFIDRLPAVRQPSSFLVGGNVRLAWRLPNGELIGLQFRGASKIQYMIFQLEGGELGTSMGVKPADAVLRMILSAELRPIIAP